MPDEEKKKKSAFKWIILLLVLLLVGAATAGAWFFFMKNTLPFSSSGTEQDSPTVVTVGKQTSSKTTTVSLPVFMTNLADPLGHRFIRLNIDVEVADAKAAEELTRLTPRTRDSILLLLSSKTYADIATTESKLMLKNEITERLNIILGTGKVHQVFVTDMVIQ